jgi:outer membrane protein assembly factor BamB
MRPPTRLLLFVLVPLAVAIGGVAWVLERQADSPAQIRRPLPATTQVVSGRPALAWNLHETAQWAAFGFIEPGGWFGAVSQRRASYDLAGGDARGGLLHYATNLKAPITGPAVASRDLLFAPTGASEISAIDLRTARPVWMAEVGGRGARLAVDGSLVVARTAERVACFDADSGRALWNVKTANITAGPGLSARYACFATPDALHVLDAATGRELRKVAIAGLRDHIVVDGDRAYACGRAGDGKRAIALHAVDLAGGAVSWQWSEEAPTWNGIRSTEIDVAGPALGDGIVAFTVEDRLCVVDAVSGRRRWLWQAERPVEGSRSGTRAPPPGNSRLLRTPAVFAGVVYANWFGDRVSGWDVATGREVWRYVIDEDFRKRIRVSFAPVKPMMPSDAPPVAADGLLLCLTSDGLNAIKCDLLPKQSPATPAAPASRVLSVSAAVGVASAAVLVAIILGVFGLWRLMIAAACGVLGALTVWAWVRSYAGAEFVGYQDVASTYPFVAHARRGISSHEGALSLGAWRRVSNEPRRGASTPSAASQMSRPEWRWERGPVETSPEGSRAALLRFAWTKRSRSSGVSLSPQAETSLTLPHWFVAAVLGVAPMAWVTGLWRDRRRRHPRGHCRDCGYDLRGITGRCPECGLEIAAKRLFGKVRG